MNIDQLAEAFKEDFADLVACHLEQGLPLPAIACLTLWAACTLSNSDRSKHETALWLMKAASDHMDADDATSH